MVTFRKNNILEKNRQGKKGLGIGLVYPCVEAVELIGMLGGFDFINLDGEHGLFTPESIDAMVRVADGYGLTTTARVPGRNPAVINQFLDRGVIGILGPHVETGEEAKALVDACRFSPEGERSWGGGRGTYFNDPRLIDQPGIQRTEFMAQANKEMLVMCQLESAKSFENIEEILAVEGLDSFSWGTNDLAQSMGHPGRPDNADVVAAQDKIADLIHSRGRQMYYDRFTTMALNSAILDTAEQFLKDNQ
jgi:4-hydroxy-2-oxoheptanedioate aldolase